jgi:hypothetical protein
MPQYNSGYTALVGGTIIQGQVLFCASNVTIKDLGFDTGSAYVAGGGTAGDGIALCGATCSNPSDPILQGATLLNVSSLNSSASALFHAIRVEHYNDVKINNIKAVYGVHGVAIKATNVIGSDISSYGHSTDDVIIKEDTYTPSVGDIQLDTLFLGYVANGDTTSGLIIDAEAAGSVSRVHVSNLSAIGLPYGVYFLLNSTFGVGAINDVTISHAAIYQLHIPALGSGFSTGIGFAGSSGTVEYSLLDNIHIVNGAGTDGNTAFLMYSQMNHSTISNVYSYNQNRSSFLYGLFTIKNWEDAGNGGAPPTFTSTLSGTTVFATGYNSFRGNVGASVSGGALIQINPIGMDGVHAILGYPLMGNGAPVQIIGDTASGTDLLVKNGAGTYNSLQIQEGSGLSFGPGNAAPSGTYISDSNKICQSNGTNCGATGIYRGAIATTVISPVTNYLMPGTGSSSGILHVRDNTSGGSAAFVIDPNGGTQLLGTSGITGLGAAQILFNSGCSGCGGNWSISLTSGGTFPRVLAWTILY